MLNFLGSIIYKLYTVIGSYGATMLIMGIVIGLIYLPRDLEKLKMYKLKSKLLPQIKEIEESEMDEGKRSEKIYQLYKNNNYNFIKEFILTAIINIISLVIFMVVFNPYEHIGIAESYSERFLIYDNIFSKSLDVIMPLIITVCTIIGANFGRPIKTIEKKEIITAFIVSFIIYFAFSSISTHLYAIYFLGSSLGSIISGMILCAPRRKMLKESQET